MSTFSWTSWNTILRMTSTVFLECIQIDFFDLYLQKRNEEQLQYSYRGSNRGGFPTLSFSYDWLHFRTRFSTPYSDLHFDVSVVYLPSNQYHVKRFNPHDSCSGFRTLHCCLPPPFPSGFGAHTFHNQEGGVLYRTGSGSVLFDQYTQVFRD